MFLFFLLVGLLMLVTGAELLVRGGGQLALALRVPALVVGLTIVAFGTSAPELLVSVTAAFNASTDMALANVNGSNIANIALVLGVAALVRPLLVDRGLIRREMPACVAIQLLVPITMLDGQISRYDGVILLIAGIAYNSLLVLSAVRIRRTLKNAPPVEIDELNPDDTGRWSMHLLMLLVGIAVLVVGADWFVEGAVEVAKRLEFSDRFIGLSVIALGTSAPEVATSVVAAFRGEVELAFGNAIGSNILNVSMVLGITALVEPIVMTDQLGWVDIGVACFATAVLLGLVIAGTRLGRVKGGLLAGVYVCYLVFGPS